MPMDRAGEIGQVSEAHRHGRALRNLEPGAWDLSVIGVQRQRVPGERPANLAGGKGEGITVGEPIGPAR